MGLEWLNAVREALEAAGFRVELGYPGKGAVHLSGCVAAVNLTAANLCEQSAEVTVTILVSRKNGLQYCQEMALQAATVLSGDGHQWRFSGWKYDSGSDSFAVEVVGTASFAPQEEPEEPVEEPQDEGCQVVIDEVEQSHVTDFLAKQKADRAFILAHGQGEPVGVTPGVGGWSIRLTQMIPTGEAEPGENTASFEMTVTRGGYVQRFKECYWTEYSTQQCAEGTQVIRTGLALSREVSMNG